MGCVTGKKMFPSRELAEEALIAARTIYKVRESSGPQSVYLCNDCGEWHLTSRNAPDSPVNNPETKERISRQVESDFWEQKFKRK